LAELALPGKPSEILLFRMADILELIQLLLSMSNAKEFELGEYRILKNSHWYILTDILPSSLPDHMCKVDYDIEIEYTRYITPEEAQQGLALLEGLKEHCPEPRQVEYADLRTITIKE
jgi:hypothetical protein